MCGQCFVTISMNFSGDFCMVFKFYWLVLFGLFFFWTVRFGFCLSSKIRFFFKPKTKQYGSLTTITQWCAQNVENIELKSIWKHTINVMKRQHFVFVFVSISLVYHAPNLIEYCWKHRAHISKTVDQNCNTIQFYKHMHTFSFSFSFRSLNGVSMHVIYYEQNGWYCRNDQLVQFICFVEGTQWQFSSKQSTNHYEKWILNAFIHRAIRSINKAQMKEKIVFFNCNAKIVLVLKSLYAKANV